eukprot:2104192-Rhodomonas_salina.5
MLPLAREIQHLAHPVSAPDIVQRIRRFGGMLPLIVPFNWSGKRQWQGSGRSLRRYRLHSSFRPLPPRSSLSLVVPVLLLPSDAGSAVYVLLRDCTLLRGVSGFCATMAVLRIGLRINRSA